MNFLALFRISTDENLEKKKNRRLPELMSATFKSRASSFFIYLWTITSQKAGIKVKKVIRTSESRTSMEAIVARCKTIRASDYQRRNISKSYSYKMQSRQSFETTDDRRELCRTPDIRLEARSQMTTAVRTSAPAKGRLGSGHSTTSRIPVRIWIRPLYQGVWAEIGFSHPAPTEPDMRG